MLKDKLEEFSLLSLMCVCLQRRMMMSKRIDIYQFKYSSTIFHFVSTQVSHKVP